jgi:iron complex outermembrane receptor protein
MRSTYNLFFIAFLLITVRTEVFSSTEIPHKTLSGKVSDKATHAAMPGATVYISDLKLGVITDASGNYRFDNLPAARMIVQVSFIGYKTTTLQIDFGITSNLDIELEPSSIEVSEVVVTGSGVSSDIRHTSVSVSTIKGKDLLIVPASNLVNSLTSIPGISAITTGGAVSKPVIRGLGYNHVITLNDGMRQEGNQWGDEHGIEIDQFAVDRIEILKGPASLLYGSDALGGVINIMEPTPAHVGHIDSEVATRYSTNNRLTSTSVMNQGNLNGFLWKVRGTYKNAASFQTPTEYVYNSGFNERDFSGTFGINRSWGYSHLHLSSYNSNIGSIEAERDSATGKFINQSGRIVPTNILEGRSLDTPFQNVSHQKIGLVNNFIINGNNQLKVNLGFQTNERKEFSQSGDTPGLFFHLATFTYDVKYLFGSHHGWEPVAGFSGMNQDNENRGTEFLIPNYHLLDGGAFFYLKKTLDKLTFNGGIRYDIRDIQIHQLVLSDQNSQTIRFQGFDTKLSAFSGALGMTWEISRNLDFKLNFGRGFRAPNIAELSSNGIHEGTFRYELGNNTLKPETSMQVDGELAFHSTTSAITVSAFYNPIANYIYQRNINGELKTVNGSTYPVYRFVQGNSLLTGFEVFADIHPVDFIHFENSISYVYAQNRQTQEPLPLIPPLHSKHTVRWVIIKAKDIFRDPYLSLGFDLVSNQNRYDAFETATKGYALLNASIGTDLMLGKTKTTLFLSGSNLTNRKYFDHLNRLKYVGIYSPGRDISFGIIIPLEKENR